LERRTGDSRNDVGLRPGGIVMQGDLEIGSLAGDMSLYLALMADDPASLWVPLILRSEPSVTPMAAEDDGGSPEAPGAPSITAFDSRRRRGERGVVRRGEERS